ncbi:MAG: transglycosylase domain-containing protein, partial [Rubrobacteraceae bacterium]
MHDDIPTKFGRRRRRHRQRSTLWGWIRNLFILACAAGILVVAGMVVSFGYTYTKLANSMPSLDNYKSVQLAQTSTIYDANGNIVDELYGVQNRYVVPLSKMNQTLPKAAVAIEDHRFYQHGGLDFEAIARAAQRNVETMSIQEGGSTLTRQLVKNTYI